MAWIGWEARLDAARNDAEVVAIARDFLASLDPLEVTYLPPACAVRRLPTANDVQAYALDIVRERRGTDEPAAMLLLRMSVFFTRVSSRLAALHAPPCMISDRALGLSRPRRDP